MYIHTVPQTVVTYWHVHPHGRLPQEMGTHLYPYSTRQYSHTCIKCLQSTTNSIRTHLRVHTIPETVSTHIYSHTVLQTAISTHISSSLFTQYHKQYPVSTTNNIRTHLPPRHPHSTTETLNIHIYLLPRNQGSPSAVDRTLKSSNQHIHPQKKGTSALLSFHTHSAYLKPASAHTEGHCIQPQQRPTRISVKYNRQNSATCHTILSFVLK